MVSLWVSVESIVRLRGSSQLGRYEHNKKKYNHKSTEALLNYDRILDNISRVEEGYKCVIITTSKQDKRELKQDIGYYNIIT